MNAGFFPKKAVYVLPGAVCNSPDYAKGLIKEGYGDCFILRSGFNPLKHDEELDRAVEIVRSLDAKCWLLVGTWWGEGVLETEDTMKTVIELDKPGFQVSHESRWQMRTPGGPADDEVKRSLAGLVNRYSPDGVCLTHARFRHPADIRGMFETGRGKFYEHMMQQGIDEEKLRNAYEKAVNTLANMTSSEAIDRVQGNTIPSFLDSIIEEDVFYKWFSLRCKVLEESIRSFKEVVKEVSKGKTLFGQNCYSPIASMICGQDYNKMGDLFDFVQPLLGYIRWHVMQPVGTWARLLKANVKGMSDSEAVETAKEIFGLRGVKLPDNIDEYFKTGEGAGHMIADIVRREFELIVPFKNSAPVIMPVLRGKDWPKEITGQLSNEAYKEFNTVAYQGSSNILDNPPGEGWN